MKLALHITWTAFGAAAIHFGIAAGVVHHDRFGEGLDLDGLVLLEVQLRLDDDLRRADVVVVDVRLLGQAGLLPPQPAEPHAPIEQENACDLEQE